MRVYDRDALDIYIYIYIYIYVFVCTCIYMYTCIYVSVWPGCSGCVYIYIYIYICVYVCMYMCIHMSVIPRCSGARSSSCSLPYPRPPSLRRLRKEEHSIRQYTSAYVSNTYPRPPYCDTCGRRRSIRQHLSAHVSIRQHYLSACVSIPARRAEGGGACVSIREHTSE